MKRGPFILVRDTDAGESFELLLVMSVATILGIRAYLALTGYPQIGGDTLHIAHMLWGGLLMMIALALLTLYWNPVMRRLSAFLGGIGFGTFIDELGKFITADNDYFFRPTVALLYVLFIVMFLVFRAVQRRRPLTAEEISTNAAIREALQIDERTDSRPVRAYYGLRRRARASLDKVLGNPAVIFSVIAVFVLSSLAQFLVIIGWINPSFAPLRTLSGIASASALGGGACVIAGVIRWRKSRITALHWFRRAILVSIFVTQPFLFYQSEFTALWGLAIDLLVYSCLSYLLRRAEEGRPR